jgi:hypothetical protein
MPSYSIPPEHLERLRALARGFISAKHGRDYTIHNLNESGVAFQKPDGAPGSSSIALWWEVLVYAQTGEVPK